MLNVECRGDARCMSCVQLDLPLLTEERKKKPNDSRVAFYLGQTYELIGDMENALTTYQERIDMGGWQQEVFEAHLRRVRPMLAQTSDECITSTALGLQGSLTSSCRNACDAGHLHAILQRPLVCFPLVTCHQVSKQCVLPWHMRQCRRPGHRVMMRSCMCRPSSCRRRSRRTPASTP